MPCHWIEIKGFYRQDAEKRQTAGIKFTHRPKIRFFFSPVGATGCTDSRQIWHGQRAPGSVWLCNILPQSAQGMGMLYTTVQKKDLLPANYQNKFTQAKNQVFRPERRLVAPIHVKLGRADGHVGSLGCAKFHLNRLTGWECGPKISKISTFW